MRLVTNQGRASYQSHVFDFRWSSSVMTALTLDSTVCPQLCPYKYIHQSECLTSERHAFCISIGVFCFRRWASLMPVHADTLKNHALFLCTFLDFFIRYDEHRYINLEGSLFNAWKILPGAYNRSRPLHARAVRAAYTKAADHSATHEH